MLITISKYRVLFIFLFSSFLTFSQSPAGIWYFGDKAGINFNLGVNPVLLNDGQMQTFEGCATLGDSFGNLLFYTDGIKVWNRNHVQMPNGNGLFGDPSSTQSAIIIPKPNDSNLYYIFTIDELGKPNGLNYSTVDMSLDNGNGDVVNKNIQLVTPTLEKINAIKHFNENDYWIITHKYNTDEFYVYKITPTGVSAAYITSVGDVIAGGSQSTLGYLKSSPNGKYIACANSKSGSSKVQLFKFDNSTGAIALIGSISLQNGLYGLGVYGVEFSNDSNLLYISNINNENRKSQIYQYNIQSEDEVIINSTQYLVTEVTSDQLSNGSLGALQLAPNKKIYVARNNVSELAVINSPDIEGVNCQFNLNGFNLGTKKSYYGLPLFISSLFDISFRNSNNCQGNLTQFEIPNIPNIISTQWDFGDPTSIDNTSTLTNPTHQFNGSGTFIVTLIIQTNLRTSSYTRQIKIVAIPVANQPSNYTLCESDALEFNLFTKKTEILGMQSSSDYDVSFHLTQDDAEDNINRLPNNYINTSNFQTIHARVQPLNSPQCYAITSFQLIVNNKPVVGEDIEVYYCLDTFPSTITLSSGFSNTNTATYNWSSGEATPTININQIGNYTVTVTNANNCSATRNILVLSSEIATINVNVNSENDGVSVIPFGQGNYVYSLDDINGFYQTNNYFENISTGLHLIYVKDLNGCGVASSSFSIISFPKYFSPNDDGFNDFWGVDAPEVESISIFDRYGKLIKELKSNENWDGKFNKQNLPSTDYWFEAKLISNKIMKGHFTLKR